jgi:hypothetical protein
MNAIPARMVRPLALVPVALSLGGCTIIGGIFKAGVWVGVVAVVLVLALVIWVVRAFSR